MPEEHETLARNQQDAPNSETHDMKQRKDYSKLAWAKFTSLVREAKNKPCVDCGVTYPYYVMHFDHRPGEIKSFELSKRSTRGRVAIEAEILKCDVVCANCHAERSFQRKQQNIVVSNKKDGDNLDIFMDHKL